MLKYIVLPGLNDGDGDYLGVIKIAKYLGVNQMQIARDQARMYVSGEEEVETTVRAVGRLAAMLLKNGIRVNVSYSFTPEEQERVKAYAAGLMENKEV